MMRRRRFIWLMVLLAVGLLLPATPALAGDGPPGDDGIIIWNEDYTLEEGESLDGDLVVFNGDVTLEAGSRVEGSVIVWNGSADVKGTVEGDLVVSSGDICLDDDAWVQGSVVCSWACELEQEEGARVDGGIVEGIPFEGLKLDRWRGLPIPIPQLTTFWVSGPGVVLDWMLGVIRSAVSILVVAAVAGLVALVWPRQVTQVGQAVVKAPAASFGIGLLTVLAAVLLAIALALTICLPLIFVAALVAAGLFGWICIGALVGEELFKALNTRETAPLWTAGLGTLVITLVTAGIDVIPCLGLLGLLLTFVVGCIGLGAVVLTRFGSTAYVPSSPLPPPVEAPKTAEPSGGEEEAAGD
jgi:hypothetical protein